MRFIESEETEAMSRELAITELTLVVASPSGVTVTAPPLRPSSILTVALVPLTSEAIVFACSAETASAVKICPFSLTARTVKEAPLFAVLRPPVVFVGSIVRMP